MKALMTGLAMAATIAPCASYANSTTTYTYDVLGRLISMDNIGPFDRDAQINTAYDAAGNRTTYTSTAPSGIPMIVVVPLNGLTIIPIPTN